MKRETLLRVLADYEAALEAFNRAGGSCEWHRYNEEVAEMDGRAQGYRDALRDILESDTNSSELPARMYAAARNLEFLTKKWMDRANEEFQMATTLSADVLQDDLAASLARALAAANKKVREAGLNVLESLISIHQMASDDGAVWRISYGPKDGVGRRGGDFIVDVDPDDASIKQVLRGQ